MALALTSNPKTNDYDAAIVGGGPAGLSAAIVLGRCRRRVVVFDHGKPRNYAAHAVHCYLAAECIPPLELRKHGRREAQSYGVEFIDAEVTAARYLGSVGERLGGFEISTSQHTYTARTVLLSTGVVDVLPEVANLTEFYGKSVHHCPYCDGWEHRDQRLVALGDSTVDDLAASLRTWSPHVTACSNGHKLTAAGRRLLDRHSIPWREERVLRLNGADGRLEQVQFESGESLRCDALFFSTGRYQHSPLPKMLGCEEDEQGNIVTSNKQKTCVDGLFLAGDADGEVQFAIVAAAEGATAGVAMNKALQKDDQTAAGP